MRIPIVILSFAAYGSSIRPNPNEEYTCTPPALTSAINPWVTYALHPNKYYGEKVQEAAEAISDPSLKRRASKIAEVGSFLWIDSISDISTIEPAISEAPCNHILGLVIRGLFQQRCSSLTGKTFSPDAGTYRSDFINPIVQILQAHSDRAFALIIEPGAVEDVVLNANLPGCQHVTSVYYEQVAAAVKDLSLRNTIIYLDAGHGGSLGWRSTLRPAAQALSKFYIAAGNSSQIRGIAVNVANYNSWDAKPGEFECADDAQCPNQSVNEMLFVQFLGREIKKTGVPVPLHAIVDTSRNGVIGLRQNWTDWCNTNGAGFGRRPTADTGFPLVDAFVWVKNGGESDGTSNTSAPGYDPFCGKPDAFKPSPEAGVWNQAFFEMLVLNAKPVLPGS